MNDFNKKQKIILGILGAIVAGFICYYVYAKDETNNIEELEGDFELQEENTEESYSDDIILVHVSGAVNNEGIVELKVDSRISDAIEKAGGIKEDAYTEEINLAYKLEDGMKIHIPTKQEKQQTNNTQDYITTSSGVIEKEKQKEETKQKKVNINTALQAELETLSGIGASTAKKIIAYRKEKGTFKKIEDIKNVSGIGEAKFEKIKEYITVK